MMRTNRLAGLRSLSQGNSLTRSAGLPAAINLLLDTLDSRVSYSGPIHSYMKSDGLLGSSAANQWPLEYRAGVAVGRHLPEAAGTNVITDTSFTSIGAVGNTSSSWVANGTATSDGVGIDSGVGRTLGSDWTLFGVYQVSTGAWLNADTVVPSVMDFSTYNRHYYLATPTAASLVRWYVGRKDSTNYIFAQNTLTASQQYVFSTYRKKDTTSGLVVSLPQIETGSFPSSPIISSVNGATRAASSVTVAKDGNATGIQLVFNDGTTQSLTFGSATSLTLPVSAVAWGTRYLTRIEYV